jgi:hypothetical protein
MEFNDDYSNKVLGVPLTSLSVEQRLNLHSQFLEEKKILTSPGKFSFHAHIFAQ